MMKGFSLLLLLGLTTCLCANDNNPEELGRVHWHRDFLSAQKLSEKEQKPILILFQEIPGCNTCKQYGTEVLSHPLLVEAIESLFIPLAIYNNRKGKDASVLAFYQELSWNNPVIRIVGTDKSDIIPRLNGNYTPGGLASYIIKALKINNQEVPNYLSLIEEELSAKEGVTEKTTLGMYCFWTGEKELGKLDGVVQTEAGFMDGHEVVNVYYDPKKIQLEEIISQGASANCADKVYALDRRQELDVKRTNRSIPVTTAKPFHADHQPKYYLSRSVYQYIPMSPIQAVKANTLVGQGKNPRVVLSPRQLAMVEAVQQGNLKRSTGAIHSPEWKALFFKDWDILQKRS